jgi:nicotinate-nucleotide adenylyltransferase
MHSGPGSHLEHHPEQRPDKAGLRGVGLFGGTFNPVHVGHLRGAEEIRNAFGLEKVLFIPAALPPHKKAEGLIDARHRLKMVGLATASNLHFSTSDIELSRKGKSFSVDTIRYFLAQVKSPLYFILGKDAFEEIETWKDHMLLFSLCNFIVTVRSGVQEIPAGGLPAGVSRDFHYDTEAQAWIHASGHTLHFHEIRNLDISSTAVRKLVAEGGSVKYLIPSEVEAYIFQHRLYGADLQGE